MRTSSLVWEYVASRRAYGRSLSPKTVQGYLDAVRHIGTYYPPSLSRVDKAVQGLHKLSTATERSYIRRWRTLARYAASEHQIPSPFERVRERPANSSLSPSRVFSPTEYSALHAACIGPIDRALLDVLLGTGIRVGELPVHEWQVSEGHLVVSGKTGTRYAAITSRDRELLLATSVNGRLWALGGVLSQRGLYTRWRRLVARAGLTGSKLGPHTCRRTFASMWVRNGGSLESLQYQLGHQSVRTTQIYVHGSPGWVEAQLAGNDPLGSLKLDAMKSSGPQRKNNPPRP